MLHVPPRLFSRVSCFLQCLTPGWATLSIKPAPGTLAHGRYDLPTVKGTISTNFTAATSALQGRLMALRVVLPLGCQAHVSVPLLGTPPAAAVLVLDGAQQLASTKCVLEGEHWTVRNVGPGTHTFEIRVA